MIQIGLILLRALNSDLAALSSTLNLCQRKSFALVTQVGVYQKINPLSSTKCLFNLVIFNMSLSQRFSVSHHLSDFQCLTISVIFYVSPSIDSDCLTISVIFTVSPSQVIFHVLLYQWFPLSHYLSDFLVSSAIFLVSPSQRFSLFHHISDFHYLIISVNSNVSPSQGFFMFYHLSDFHCLTITTIFSVSPSPWLFISQWTKRYL